MGSWESCLCDIDEKRLSELVCWKFLTHLLARLCTRLLCFHKMASLIFWSEKWFDAYLQGNVKMQQNQPKDGGKIPVITVKNGTQAFFFIIFLWMGLWNTLVSSFIQALRKHLERRKRHRSDELNVPSVKLNSKTVSIKQFLHQLCCGCRALWFALCFSHYFYYFVLTLKYKQTLSNQHNHVVVSCLLAN